MYLTISRKPRNKNRTKTNRRRAKLAAKNRKRVQGMRGKSRARKLAKKW